MSKKIIKGLSKWALVKDFTARIGKVNAAADTKVPELNSYPQNVLKERLHPDVQHLTVVEIIPHGKDVKTFVFAPDKEEGTERLGYFSLNLARFSLDSGKSILLAITTLGFLINDSSYLASSL